MGIEEGILEYQLSHGVFENASFAGTEGIAKLAVEKGFNTLSPKQKAILEPYLTVSCSGYTDPGGNFNACSVELQGQELLDAYQQSDDAESIICDSCNSEVGYFEHQWNKISEE
mgnify:CR=1 FL=1